MKKPPKRITALFLALVFLAPVFAGWGIYKDFHAGQWLMWLGLFGLVALGMAVMVTGGVPEIGDREVG